jgi:prefoldin subunit 5
MNSIKTDLMIRPMIAEEARSLEIFANPFGDLSQLGPEAMMIVVQMMVAKDFDEQIKNLGKKIDFLDKIKDSYQERVNTLQEFLAKPKDSEKQVRGAQVINTTPEEASKAIAACYTTTYDLEKLEVTSEVPMTFSDRKADDQLKGAQEGKNGFCMTDGEATAAEIVADLDSMSHEEKAARDFMGSPGIGKMMWVRAGYTDGTAMVQVSPSFLENKLEELKTIMSKLDGEISKLSSRLEQLMNQRKKALEGVNQTLNKRDEAISKSISHME